MISVSDILKLLDQVPIWKTLRELPKRVAALEARLDAMAAVPAKAPGETCNACGEPAVRRISSKQSAGPFGMLGSKDEVWTCQACGDSETRLVSR